MALLVSLKRCHKSSGSSPCDTGATQKYGGKNAELSGAGGTRVSVVTNYADLVASPEVGFGYDSNDFLVLRCPVGVVGFREV